MTFDEFVESVMVRLKDPEGKLLAIEDYQDHVVQAIVAYSNRRPRILRSSLTLTAGVDLYPAPPQFIGLWFTDWGRPDGQVKPWDRGNGPSQMPVRTVPTVLLVEEQLLLTPPPTAVQISAFGPTFQFLYESIHVVTNQGSTIPPGDDPIVKLKALSTSCKEIAAMPNQADGFVQRYYTLAKRYKEDYEELILNPRTRMIRS